MDTSPLIPDTRKLIAEQTEELTRMGYSSFLLKHFGELNQDLINSFSETIEDLLISAGEKKPMVKRIFSILIEGLQNILIHGQRIDGEQLASVIVAASPDSFAVFLGNITDIGEKDKLERYVGKLNNFSDEEVKSYYLEVLNNGLISEKGGAGLGFITMRMKSGNQLRMHFEAISEELAFFTIGTVLNRV